MMYQNLKIVADHILFTKFKTTLLYFGGLIPNKLNFTIIMFGFIVSEIDIN